MRSSLVRSSIAIVLAVALGGCGLGEDLGFEMGVRRIALSLAFSDEEKANAVEPRTIIHLLPAPPDALDPGFAFDRPPTVLPAKCPPAPENAGIADVARVGIARPPSAGRYPRHNVGALTIRGAFDIRLPFPRQTSWTIEDVREIEPPPVTEDPLGPAASPNEERAFPYVGEEEGLPMWEYTVRKTLTADFAVVDTYRLTSQRLLLLRRETTTSDGSSVFVPDPPVTFLEHTKTENDAWRSGGVDTETGQAMYIDAIIEKREGVDVCGTVHDSYRVAMQERMVNLSTGETSGTEDGDPNVYHVATQLGGLILREDAHFTQTITTPEGAAVVVWEYISTMDSTEPRPA